jgi:hypothetical protein
MPKQRSVTSRPTEEPAQADMSHRDEGSSIASTPTSALQCATEDPQDIEDAEVIAHPAREIARDDRGHEDGRHDEYDDPDQGGEA